MPPGEKEGGQDAKPGTSLGAAVPSAAARGSTEPARCASPPAAPSPPPNPRPRPLPPPGPAPLSPPDPAPPARAPRRQPGSRGPASAPHARPPSPRGPWGSRRATGPRPGCTCSTSCPAPTSSSARCPATSRRGSRGTSRWEPRGDGAARGPAFGCWEAQGPRVTDPPLGSQGGGDWAPTSGCLREEACGAPIPGGSPGTGAWGDQTPPLCLHKGMGLGVTGSLSPRGGRGLGALRLQGLGASWGGRRWPGPLGGCGTGALKVTPPSWDG